MDTISQRRLAALAAVISITVLHAWMTRADGAAVGETQKDGRSWKRVETFSPAIAPNGLLNVRNYNGSITMVPSDSEAITVQVTKKVTPKGWGWFGSKASAAETALDDLEIGVAGSAGALSFETGRLPRRSGFNASVNYDIQLPRGARAELKSTNGHIRVSGARDHVVANTTNGKIRVTDVAGPVDAHTTNGKIEVTDADGPVSAHTTNGGIELRGLRHGLEATSSNGAIICHFDGAVPRNERVECRTTNGAITLRAAPDSTFSIDASTSNGSVRSVYPLSRSTTSKRNRLVGDVGEGGAAVTLKTTNGSISLEHG
jgi:hypothetical protein